MAAGLIDTPHRRHEVARKRHEIIYIYYIMMRRQGLREFRRNGAIRGILRDRKVIILLLESSGGLCDNTTGSTHLITDYHREAPVLLSATVEDLKLFMNTLLARPAFDSFLLTEGSVTTCMTYLMDGHYRTGYFDREDAGKHPEYVAWGYVRPHVFDMIRGHQKPLKMRFVFRAPEEIVQKLLSDTGAPLTSGDVSGLYINIVYVSGSVSVTSGTALRVFSADRSLEQAWDRYVTAMFRQLNIAIQSQL